MCDKAFEISRKCSPAKFIIHSLMLLQLAVAHPVNAVSDPCPTNITSALFVGEGECPKKENRNGFFAQ